MSEPTLVYPVIFSEFNDDGHYYTVTSPNIPGMITQGDTIVEAAKEAIDAIATMLDGTDYPKPQDPTNWELQENQRINFVTVDMPEWYRQKNEWLNRKTVRRSITVPEYLNDFAKEHHINVSRLTTDALKRERDLQTDHPQILSHA